LRVLVQRVDRAAVSFESGETRSIGKGLLILLGVGPKDDEASAKKLADKCVNLRIFSNDEGKFDRSLLDEKGEMLVISQFTLYGEAKGGRRPDFTGAARPETAVPLYARFVEFLKSSGLPVKTGEFAAHMKIESVNDGPVTLWLDSERL
jgi:D-tyrosyl-tRNA(Tyr) deacylase